MARFPHTGHPRSRFTEYCSSHDASRRRVSIVLIQTSWASCSYTRERLTPQHIYFVHSRPTRPRTNLPTGDVATRCERRFKFEFRFSRMRTGRRVINFERIHTFLSGRDHCDGDVERSTYQYSSSDYQFFLWL